MAMRLRLREIEVPFRKKLAYNPLDIRHPMNATTLLLLSLLYTFLIDSSLMKRGKPLRRCWVSLRMDSMPWILFHTAILPTFLHRLEDCTGLIAASNFYGAFEAQQQQMQLHIKS